TGDAAGGVWKSSDGGATWGQLSGGLPSGAHRIALSISPDGSTLYAARADAADHFDAVYVSSDRGLTWTRGGALPTVGDPECLPEQQPSYDLAVQLDPSSAAFATAYLGLAGLYKSIDGGTSWSYVGAGAPADYHAIQIAATGLFV